MARTHVHRPATLPHADAARSRLKSSMYRYGSSSSHVSSLIKSFLFWPNSLRTLRVFASPASALPEVSHESVIQILFLTGSAPGTLSGWCSSTATPSKMRLMSGGGDVSFFSVVKSLAVMESSASTARLSVGSALRRSSMADSSPALTTAASASSLFFTFSTSARFASASAVRASISFTSASVSLRACPSFTSFSCSFVRMTRTSSAACCSLSRPLLILSADSETSACFWRYTSVYEAMNDRYDLGVEYTSRR
mmetsp:Transcript_19370/g.60191  ORF Transcript_19370/g.60191 Transcript_19370/m.60191 type:complete len:253 (+) Transcript_19370:1136-1894(+)